MEKKMGNFCKILMLGCALTISVMSHSMKRTDEFSNDWASVASTGNELSVTRFIEVGQKLSSKNLDYSDFKAWLKAGIQMNDLEYLNAFAEGGQIIEDSLNAYISEKMKVVADRSSDGLMSMPGNGALRAEIKSVGTVLEPKFRELFKDVISAGKYDEFVRFFQAIQSTKSMPSYYFRSDNLEFFRTLIGEFKSQNLVGVVAVSQEEKSKLPGNSRLEIIARSISTIDKPRFMAEVARIVELGKFNEFCTHFEQTYGASVYVGIRTPGLVKDAVEFYIRSSAAKPSMSAPSAMPAQPKLTTAEKVAFAPDVFSLASNGLLFKKRSKRGDGTCLIRSVFETNENLMKAVVGEDGLKRYKALSGLDPYGPENSKFFFELKEKVLLDFWNTVNSDGGKLWSLFQMRAFDVDATTPEEYYRKVIEDTNTAPNSFAYLMSYLYGVNIKILHPMGANTLSEKLVENSETAIEGFKDSIGQMYPTVYVFHLGSYIDPLRSTNERGNHYDSLEIVSAESIPEDVRYAKIGKIRLDKQDPSINPIVRKFASKLERVAVNGDGLNQLLADARLLPAADKMEVIRFIEKIVAECGDKDLSLKFGFFAGELRKSL